MVQLETCSDTERYSNVQAQPDFKVCMRPVIVHGCVALQQVSASAEAGFQHCVRGDVNLWSGGLQQGTCSHMRQAARLAAA